MPRWLTWREAANRALYADDGFFRRPGGPAAHFRTSVHASPTFADAVLGLLDEVDAALGHPDTLDFVDIGAGRGELVRGVLERAPGRLRSRLRLHAVELADPPADLPEEIGWSPEVPKGITGLVVANEWLDDIPVDVVQRTPDGRRLVLVDPATGEETLGGAPGPDDQMWLDAWWPLDIGEAGDRAEIGRPRDEAWATVVNAVSAGLLVAIDYAHSLADRATGLLPAGTMVGYARGRACLPIPDGSCDVTCHVALDACAIAGERAGAEESLILTQREALRSLGVCADRPDPWLARTDPDAYLRALQQAGSSGELIARGGLGDFGWLVQAVGVPVPPLLHDATR